MDDRLFDLHAAPRPAGVTRRTAIVSAVAGLLLATGFGAGFPIEDASAAKWRRVRNRRRNRNSNRRRQKSIEIPGEPGEPGDPGEP